MKMTSALLPLIILSTFLPAHADTKDVAELSTVNVSGEKVKGPEITTDKLLKIAGAGNDPLKAVEALPGVILSGSGRFSVPAVRGSSPEDNIYITDFLPVGYVFHNDGSSTYNDNLIERFSLKSGAWDPEFSNAIGAVLDTQLRDPYQESLRTTVDLSFLRAGALIEGAVTDDSAFYFSYRRSLLEYYIENIIDEDELTFTEVPRNSDYQFKYHWRLSPVSNLRVIATGANDSVGIEFGPESDELEREPGLAGGLAADTYYHNQGIVFDTLLDGGTSTVLAFSRKEEDISFNIGRLFNLDAIDYEYRLKNYYTTPLNNGDNMRYGVDLSNTEIKYSASGVYTICNEEVGDTCPPASLGFPFEDDDTLTINDVYSFVAYDLLAAPNLEVTLGLGIGYNDFNNEVLPQPRLATRYALNSNWTLTSAVGRHSQFIREFRFIAKEVGNPDLKQPIADHYVVGFEHQIDDSLSTKFEIYYKDIDNLIAANPERTADNTSVVPFLNNANGEAYGLELLINKNLTDKWYGWFSVAYSKTKRENESTGKKINYELDRPWVVNLVASYQKNERLSYGFKWRYQSGSLVTPINGAVPYYECTTGEVTTYQTSIGADCGSDPYIYDPTEGEPNSQRLSDYHRLDFRADYELSNDSTLYFEIINLYNRANVSEISYNKDYSEKEKVTSLPVIFSFGVKMVF